MKKHTNLGIITGLMIVIGILRSSAAHMWATYSFDDIISISIASLPLAHIWEYARFEMHPPAYFYLLHFWTQLFGTTPFIVKASTVLTNILLIPSAYLLGKTAYTSPRAGIVMAIAAGFIGLVSFQTVLIRMGVLLVLSTILSYYFFLKAQQSSHQSWYVIGYIITTTLALYTHITAVFIIAIHLAYLLYTFYKKYISKKQLYTWIAYLSIPSLLYLPWFIHFLITRFTSLDATAWYIHAPYDALPWLSMPFKLLIRFSVTQVFDMVAYIFFAAIILYGIFRIIYQPGRGLTIIPNPAPATVLGIFTVLIPTIILSTINLNPIRYYAIGIIGLLLLITAGMIRIQQPKNYLIALALLITFLLPTSLQTMSIRHPNWKRPAEYILEHEQAGDRIITGFSAEQLALDYYYTGTIPVDVFVPEDHKELYTDDMLKTAILTNINFTISPENRDDFAHTVGDSTHVFFVYNPIIFGSSYELYIQWFLDNGWKREDYLKTPHTDDVQVWHLTKQ